MEVDGKTVGFRFNMLAFGKACELEGCDLTQLYSRLGIYGGDTNLLALNHFFFAAAINYAEGKNLPIDFTKQDVSDWLDIYGIEKSMEMMTDAFKSPQIKNAEAPKTEPNQ